VTDAPVTSAEAPVRKPSRWDRLSTGFKMWIILSVGLLPLGIIAIMASVENARANREKANVEAQGLLAIHVQRFTLALSRNAFTIRAARDALLEAEDATGICARTLGRLDRAPNTPGRFALYAGGPAPRCVSPGFRPPAAPAAQGQIGRAIIAPDRNRLVVFLYDPSGAVEGVAEYRREALARVVDTPAIDDDFALELVQNGRNMPLRARSSSREAGEIRADFPFVGGQYVLRIRVGAPPISLSEILAILSPVLMWLWASLVGWILVQRLLLSPLRRIQGVIAAYKPGDRGLDLPKLSTPAQEIGALGEAFERMTRTVARHEAELEAAVLRQKRLVREVHHRVKNNLQVVASLLNLHSRGSANDEVAAAYASIQRRVDALAVVHRNHYAELEENRGVALKPLISELAANLRATAPARAAGMQIRLDIASLHVIQDVAVSVAFLVTEIVEFGMLCGASAVSVVLEPDEPGCARLSVQVDSLAGAVDCDQALEERFERIITGLARQLRSALDRDSDAGRYAVRINTLGSEES
jgi:two-component system, sensor histidine kinase PdtaS